MVRKAADVDGADFLNVDLDLVARADLSPLLERFGKSVFVLRNTRERGVHTLSLELSPDPRDANQAVLRYAALARALPRSARKLWRACRERTLNVGLQAGAVPVSGSFVLSEAAVASAAAISARIVITVYPPPRR